MTRFLLAAAIAAVPLLAAPPAAEAASDAASELAETYSPVIVVQPQATPCGPGEPYRPTVVDLVLGN